MAWFINPSGYEVWLDRTDIERIASRGDLDRFQPRLFKHAGQGAENKVAIIFSSINGSNGIGDYVHGMPALTAKVQSGFECHVYTTPFFRPFIEWCGAVWHDAGTLGLGSLAELMREYGSVYSLLHWCIQHDEETFGAVWKPRFEQIADMLDVKLPDSYSWKSVFGVSKILETGAIGLGLQSTSRERSYARFEETAELIRQEFTEELFLFGGNNAHQEPWHKTAKSVPELIHWLSQCKAVVAVDNGILALALAMEIPTLAIFGPTDEATIAMQFSRYVDTGNLRVLRSSLMDSECQRPCSLQRDRGFHANGKCLKGIMSDCMAELQPRQIADSLKELIAHVPLQVFVPRR